jgi:AraC-like DNA-binding protein
MFFKNDELSIELLGVFKITRQEYRNKSFDNRVYDSLSIRLKGIGKFETKEKSFEAKRGDVLYVPQDANYRQASDGETIISVHFINYNRKSYDKLELITVEDCELLEDRFCRMYDVWKEKKQGYKYLCTSLLYELLYYFNCRENDRVIDSVSHDIKIGEAMDYIHRNYRRGEISVAELSKICRVSEAYFRKLFKKIHGVSPVQYITALKLEFASHLLKSGLYTVSEAGLKSGFNDPKYFGRAFKKHYGVTPKGYQKNSEN